jgi:methyl-accepting chemotaxis protein
MAVLHNQKIGTKILVVLAVILFLTLVVGGVGLYSALNLSNLNQNISGHCLIPIELIDEVQLISKDTEGKLLRLIQITDPAEQQLVIQAIDENTKAINQLQDQYQVISLNTFEKQEFDELQKELIGYRQARSDIIKLATAGRAKEAFALYETSQPVFAKTLAIRTELSQYNIKRGKELGEQGIAMASVSSKLLIGVTMLALLLSGVLGVLLTKTISVPLAKMVVAVAEIANGDLREQQNNFISQDELGQLAQALTKMRRELYQIVMRITQSSEQVAASSEKLTATAEQSAQAANQIAEAISDVAGGGVSQVKAANYATEIIENMSVHIEQAVLNAHNVTTVMDRTATAATQGLAAVNRAISQIGNIEKTVANSAKVVEKLGERSKDIGQIVQTISEIAGQTNLLALNAAIEAARAGEQGRGFSVVAEEVRKLAEQSEFAAKQITSLIRETQQDTDKAVSAMSEGNQEVKVGTEVVNTAGQAFKEIVKAINQISSQMKEVSLTIQQMAASSQEIVSAIKKIDKVTTQTATQTATVSAAIEEQSAAIEEIASSSQGLAQLAEKLQNVILKFRT